MKNSKGFKGPQTHSHALIFIFIRKDRVVTANCTTHLGETRDRKSTNREEAKQIKDKRRRRFDAGGRIDESKQHLGERTP